MMAVNPKGKKVPKLPSQWKTSHLYSIKSLKEGDHDRATLLHVFLILNTLVTVLSISTL
jgi:hypothetical protein